MKLPILVKILRAKEDIINLLFPNSFNMEFKAYWLRSHKFSMIVLKLQLDTDPKREMDMINTMTLPYPPLEICFSFELSLKVFLYTVWNISYLPIILWIIYLLQNYISISRTKNIYFYIIVKLHYVNFRYMWNSKS